MTRLFQSKASNQTKHLPYTLHSPSMRKFIPVQTIDQRLIAIKSRFLRAHQFEFVKMVKAGIKERVGVATVRSAASKGNRRRKWHEWATAARPAKLFQLPSSRWWKRSPFKWRLANDSPTLRVPRPASLSKSACI